MDKNLTKTPAKNKIYFFGYPQHGNLGDHAIALAIIDRLKKHFPDNEIITVPVDEGVKDILTTEKYTSDIKPEDLIVITGGGNMGNQYIGEEYLRQLVIRSFPKNKIISFPQTIHFVDNGCNYVKYYNDYLKNTYGVSTDWLENTSKQYMIDCFKSVYESHPNLYIFAREKYSYDILKNLLPSSNVYMTPDIVLQNIYRRI